MICDYCKKDCTAADPVWLAPDLCAECGRNQIDTLRAEFARLRSAARHLLHDIDAGHDCTETREALSRLVWQPGDAPEEPMSEDDRRIQLAYMTGAAAAFGLMGMAEAIRAADDDRRREADRENHACTCPASWGADYCDCAAVLYGAAD